ncbi:MAG TPA: DUF3291 domain-containing protein [Rudaea sp.]|jgi:hypothetical protein
MPKFELAQVNIATMKFPLDSPAMAEFVASLDPINALAEGSSGFVWRLKDDGGNATGYRPLGANVLFNMSVWLDVASLRDYAFWSAHGEVMRRRREWFEPMTAANAALWWIDRGHRPTIAEAIERLEHLRASGPSPGAFTFRRAYPAPDAGAVRTIGFDDACPTT